MNIMSVMERLGPEIQDALDEGALTLPELARLAVLAAGILEAIVAALLAAVHKTARAPSQ